MDQCSISFVVLFLCCTVPSGLLAVLVGVPFFSSICFKRILLMGYYIKFSSFSIILFAVDLSFPIFVSAVFPLVTCLDLHKP